MRGLTGARPRRHYTPGVGKQMMVFPFTVALDGSGRMLDQAQGVYARSLARTLAERLTAPPRLAASLAALTADGPLEGEEGEEGHGWIVASQPWTLEEACHIGLPEGTEYVLVVSGKTAVHGTEVGAKDTWHGLKEGSEVVAQYTAKGATKTAVEGMLASLVLRPEARWRTIPIARRSMKASSRDDTLISKLTRKSSMSSVNTRHAFCGRAHRQRRALRRKSNLYVGPLDRIFSKTRLN